MCVCVCACVRPSPFFSVTAATLSVKRGHITSTLGERSETYCSASIIIQPSSLTLGAHVQRGLQLVCLRVCLPVCVCVSTLIPALQATRRHNISDILAASELREPEK